MTDNKQNVVAKAPKNSPELNSAQILNKILANHKLNAEKILGINGKVLRKD